MADNIIYCLNGCMRNVNGQRISVQTEPPSLLCRRCEDDLRKWLREIPERYALLPHFIDFGVADRNPEAKASKRTDAPAPMRLEVIDHLDDRLALRWNGTVPTDKRRGIVGVLHDHAQRTRDDRNLTPLNQPPTVSGEAAFLQRHSLWLSEQEWVTEVHYDLKRVNNQLRDAIGDHKPRPVGVCVVTSDKGECGGPLLPSRVGGVWCPRCGDTWDIDELRRLGLLLSSEKTA